LGKEVKPLCEYLKFYEPPRNVKELIEERDKATIVNCKTGHNVCFCIECNEVCCMECKTLASHAKIHGMESIYFSLLTGGIIFTATKQIKSKCLYENNFGSFWTPDKAP